MQLVIQPEGLADGVGVAAEEALPQLKAQHDDWLRLATGSNVRGLNRPTCDRRNSEKVKRVSRQPDAGQTFRSEFSSQKHVARAGCHHIRKGWQPGQLPVLVQLIRAHPLVVFGTAETGNPDL